MAPNTGGDGGGNVTTNQSHCNALQGMGFSADRAKEALHATGGESLKDALLYLGSDGINEESNAQPDSMVESDDDIGSGEEEEEDEDEIYLDEDEDEEIEYYDDEDDEYVFTEVEVSTSAPTQSCLDLDGIRKAQSAEMTRVSGVLEISTSEAGALLRHFKWNVEALLEKFFENKDEVLALTGLSLNSSHGSEDGAASVDGSTGSHQGYQLDPEGKYDCGICGDDDLPCDKVAAASCGEIFCADCWEQYLTMKIKEGEVASLSCMGYKCNAHVSEDIVKRLVPDDIYDRYERFLSRSFVEDNRNVKWCPAAGCGNAIVVHDTTVDSVDCKCGASFCFTCNNGAHHPATCGEMVRWEKKCKDDSETCKWISVNTKTCPKCYSSIEKNGGCNHMTCRKCHHEFCWLCVRNWRGHTNCNSFQADPSQQQAASGGTKESLQRYLFYFHRFDAHKKSLELESDLRERSKQAMIELSRSVDVHIDTSFVEEATEMLLKCRRVLMHSYVSAFYKEEGPERALLEYLQAELEKNTEKLSFWVETEWDDDITSDQKRLGLINCSRMAGQRLKNLREGLAQGFIPEGS